MAMVKVVAVFGDGSEGETFEIECDSDEEAQDLAQSIFDGVEEAEQE
jgi:hypothetical protein